MKRPKDSPRNFSTDSEIHLERNSSPLRSFLHFSNRLEKREERLPTSPIFIDKTLPS